MRKLGLVAAAALLVPAGLMGRTAHAYTPADLTIIEIKMTGSETVVLENTSPADIDLSNYLLQYFNKTTPTSLAVPTSTQALPAALLPAGHAILISGDSAATCGAALVANEAFAMSDSAGYLAVTKLAAQPNGNLMLIPQDHVSWTSGTSGADLVKIPSNTADSNAVWYRAISDGSWQQADLDGSCNRIITLLSPASPTGFIEWADGSEPPAIVLADSPAASDSTGASIPLSDIGLAAPQITEVLPNPDSPQTDSEDEFIEIYNPNDAQFDLSGFKLSVGTNSSRSFTFPSGTIISPRAFKAFFSIDTNLSLSNSGSQARLLDPFGTLLSQSAVYANAKDGQSWALANGQWFWTARPTPNATNVISGTAASGKAAKGSSRSTASVKAASTSSLGSSPTSSTDGTTTPPTSQLHPWTLAGVGSLALLYAAYEYRVDLANRVGQFRRYAAARRTAGK